MNFETLMTLFIKKYFLVTFATLFGALAHALENVRNNGWKGSLAFISDMIVCGFVGFTFFHFAQLIYPENQQALVLFTALGSHWGTKGFVIMREWIIKSIKANI